MEEAGVEMGKGHNRDGREERDGLGLEFGFSSSDDHLPHHPQKLFRTDAFPFRAASPFTTTTAASGAHSTHLPPLHPSSFITNTSSAGSPTFFYCNNGGIYDSYDAGARALQPFVNPFTSQAGTGGSTALRYPVFTPAQWQELKRQALIYKHIVSSVPIPPDLLFHSRALPSIPPLYPNLGRGSGYFNLRFTNNTDPEPGRCRRTDGKKWRCSRDVATEQKYCERHMHRGRPRSRKPVEQRQKTTEKTVTAAATSTTAPSNAASTLASKPCSQASSALLPKPDVRLPFLSMVPEKEPRYMDWMKGGGLVEMHSNDNSIALRNATPVLRHYEEQLNLNYSDLNDPCNSFLSPDLSSLDEGHVPDHRFPPRRFIDAWSSESVTITSNKPSVSSAGNLSPSTLTLSMSGGVEDHDKIQMGLGINDPVKSLPPSWMNPVSPLGGPLAEVLQSGTATSSPDNSGHGDGAMCRSYAGNINLMSEGVSPRDSPPRVLSSPTGVLQRTFVSLSDSSSNSSPTFGAAGGRSEIALQWMSHTK